MKKTMYKLIFHAKQKLPSGYESRVLRVVYAPKIDEITKKRVTPEQCIERGKAALVEAEKTLYDIEYKNAIETELILA